MGRGVSSGGGQSSLGYLFGSDEPPKGSPPSAAMAQASSPGSAVTSASVPAISNDVKENPSAAVILNQNNQPPLPPAGIKTPVSDINGVNPDIPAGQLGTNPNNYHRADGQNTGNFITDRPSTKVHAAPGGGSSLGYLFGGN